MSWGACVRCRYHASTQVSSPKMLYRVTASDAAKATKLRSYEEADTIRSHEPPLMNAREVTALHAYFTYLWYLDKMSKKKCQKKNQKSLISNYLWGKKLKVCQTVNFKNVRKRYRPLLRHTKNTGKLEHSWNT